MTTSNLLYSAPFSVNPPPLTTVLGPEQTPIYTFRSYLWLQNGCISPILIIVSLSSSYCFTAFFWWYFIDLFSFLIDCVFGNAPIYSLSLLGRLGRSNRYSAGPITGSIEKATAPGPVHPRRLMSSLMGSWTAKDRIVKSIVDTWTRRCVLKSSIKSATGELPA